MIARNEPTVQRILIGSYTSGFGLPDGEEVRYWCAWCCDSGARLYDTESTDAREAAELIAARYPDAVLVAEITVIEKGGRL